jgi:hypothetical protein
MSVIWEACAGKEWCVQIPFDGKKCFSARACIRVLEENAKFYLEIEIAGNRQRIPLANGCLEARYYVFAAKACITNVKVVGKSIDFDVVLRLCIDVNIGPIHIGECVDIYRHHVHIGFLKMAELAALGFDNPIAGVKSVGDEPVTAYVETDISVTALEELHLALESR